jgi:hypothetical protein
MFAPRAVFDIELAMRLFPQSAFAYHSPIDAHSLRKICERLGLNTNSRPSGRGCTKSPGSTPVQSIAVFGGDIGKSFIERFFQRKATYETMH